MKKTFLSLATFSLLMLTACKKDNSDVKSVTVTKESVAGTYKITKVEMKTGSTRTDITNEFYNSFQEECDRDNTTKFNTDGTYVIDDGAVQCSPSSNDTGEWSVSGTNALVIDNENVGVESFDGNTLKLVDDYSSGGQTNQIIISYARQ